ncbi:hypothetical protein Q604_UNBC10374G0001, partial [human gut metagenome]
TNDDILLHKDQQTSPVAIGDEVEVFLYRDPKGRLTASMRFPSRHISYFLAERYSLFNFFLIVTFFPINNKFR